MQRATPLIALAASILLAVGLLLGRVVGNSPEVLSSVARIDVDTRLRVAAVGDILGAVVNEHYWGSTDPVHPDWYDDYLGRTVPAVRELAPVSGRKFAVRFGHTPTDGGWGRDGYHWIDALDPKGWNTSIDEFMEYAFLVNGEPYVAVNFGSGTAAEAASLVTYTNGTDPSNRYVRMRQERGRMEPYGVRHWIVGFEQYASWETGHLATREHDFANPEALNGGDPAWYGKPSANPRDFASRVAEYAKAMRSASPTPLRVYAPINNWDLAYWGGPEESVGAILGTLGGALDGVSLHFYPTNPGYGETDEDLLGRPDTFASRIDQLRGLITRHTPAGKSLDIVDVEYNNRSSTNGQTHQLVNGLFAADTLRVMATKGVGSAFYFAVSTAVGNGSGFTYFEGGDVRMPTPTYQATRLLSQHLGSEVVRSEVSRSKVVTAPGGTSGAFSYPTLTSLATLSPDGQDLYLVVINKHLVYDQRAEITVSGFSSEGRLQGTVLSGATPHETAAGVALSSFTLLAEPTILHTFPAHSITAMRLHRSR